MDKTRHIPIETPWGPSQTCSDIAPGIQFYSTAGHGGFRLDPDRQKAITAAVQFGTFWAQLWPEWFEEDEDCMVLAVVFPADMDPAFVFESVRHLRQAQRHQLKPRWADVLRYLASDDGAAAVAVHDKYLADHGDEYRSGSLQSLPCGAAAEWVIEFRRIKDGLRVVRAGEYPMQETYTQAQIDAMPTLEQVTKPKPKPQPATVLDESNFTGVLGADGNCYSDAGPGL